MGNQLSYQKVIKLNKCNIDWDSVLDTDNA